MTPEEREAACNQARRDREEASNQIGVLDDEISRQRDRAERAGDEAARSEEHLSIAARTSAEAESNRDKAMARSERAASAHNRILEATLLAERVYNESRAEINLTGILTHARLTDWEDKKRELESAVQELESATSAYEAYKREYEQAEQRIPGYQQQVSSQRAEETSARAQVGALTDERSRRASQRADAEGRVNEYCG
jgi:chromosome segregation ATPase